MQVNAKGSKGLVNIYNVITASDTIYMNVKLPVLWIRKRFLWKSQYVVMCAVVRKNEDFCFISLHIVL